MACWEATLQLTRAQDTIKEYQRVVLDAYINFDLLAPGNQIAPSAVYFWIIASWHEKPELTSQPGGYDPPGFFTLKTHVNN